MTLPMDHVVTMLGDDADHPAVRTMLAALWVDRGNGIFARTLLQACCYVASGVPAQRAPRATAVLAHCASDEALCAFLDQRVPGDAWLEEHHEAHAKRLDDLKPKAAVDIVQGVDELRTFMCANIELPCYEPVMLPHRFCFLCAPEQYGLLDPSTELDSSTDTVDHSGSD